MFPLLRSSIRFLALVAAPAAGPAALGAEPLQVLYFTKSSGYEHAVVRWDEAAGTSHSEQVLRRLGAEHEIDFTFSKDGSLFDKEYLEQFVVVMFYTSGDLLSAGEDGQPPMTPEGKRALLRAVAEGMGFVGVPTPFTQASRAAAIPRTARVDTSCMATSPTPLFRCSAVNSFGTADRRSVERSS